MKQKQYSIHVTCNAHQFSKIQRYVRKIVPTVTKQQRLINQYKDTFEKLMADGLTAQDIYMYVSTNRDDDQEPISLLQTYRIINNMGYKLAYTKQK